MQEINYRELRVGQEITVVTAWAETESFEDISNGHFFKTNIEKVYFEPRGERCFLRIWAKDGDGEMCRVNWVLENNRIVSSAVVIPTAELKAQTEMICLTDRATEFADAIHRAEKSDLEVFADFEPDTYVVVNRGNGKEYRINLQTLQNAVFAKCECADFSNRKRICKHLSAVLTDTVFGRLGKNADAKIKTF